MIKKTYVCLEHCAYYWEGDCGHNSCDDEAVYVPTGDHPLCPLYDDRDDEEES